MSSFLGDCYCGYDEWNGKLLCIHRLQTSYRLTLTVKRTDSQIYDCTSVARKMSLCVHITQGMLRFLYSSVPPKPTNSAPCIVQTNTFKSKAYLSILFPQVFINEWNFFRREKSCVRFCSSLISSLPPPPPPPPPHLDNDPIHFKAAMLWREERDRTWQVITTCTYADDTLTFAEVIGRLIFRWTQISKLEVFRSFLHVRITKYARVSTMHCECICTHCSNPKPNPPPLLIYLLYSLHWEARGFPI